MTEARGTLYHRTIRELLDASAVEWQAQAACKNISQPDIFFPGRGESSAPAKAICAGCPVRAECLDYALSHGERVGIWGGTSERERRRMRSRRGRTAA